MLDEFDDLSDAQLRSLMENASEDMMALAQDSDAGDEAQAAYDLMIRALSEMQSRGLS